MPRVTFVKSARKNNPVAKKGESYYWWAFMQGGRGGPKRYSKTKPRQSQLTQSDFWSAWYGIVESIEDNGTPLFDDLESSIEDLKAEIENLKDDTQGKFDNMPQGLQDGDSGQMLQERVDALEDVIGNLDSVDTSLELGPDIEGMEDGDEKEKAISEAEDSRAVEVWDEAAGCLDVSCS